LAVIVELDATIFRLGSRETGLFKDESITVVLTRPHVCTRCIVNLKKNENCRGKQEEPRFIGETVTGV
jgi:hypothetical protein